MPGQKDRHAAVSRCRPLQRAWTSAAFLRRVAASGRREERLATQRHLCGEHLTEADWRLLATLVRFDPVYAGHFKCNLRRLVDYPSLWGYTTWARAACKVFNTDAGQRFRTCSPDLFESEGHGIV